MTSARSATRLRMQPFQRWLGACLLLGGMAIVAPDASAANAESTASPSADTATIIGQLKGKLIDGSDFDVAAHKGHVVLVTYWATWCPNCQAESKALDPYYRAHHDAGFDVIAVSIDEPSEAEQVRKFAQKLAYPVAFAHEVQSQGEGASCSRTNLLLFKIPNCNRAIPVNYILDRNGKLAAEIDRGLDAAALKQLVDPLLAAQP